MAKQLKLNIKNTQLAKALNLGKKKEEKKPEKEKEVPKRKAIRKAISKNLDDPAVAEAVAVTPEPTVEEVKPEPPIAEEEKKVEEAPVRRKIDLSRIESTRPKTGPRAAPKPAATTTTPKAK
ncbi:MAG: hypothetical protein P0S94_03355, partial [Simkaniaceae bacterium]|nr:hypothetical protein [Simkaniaceae bacterium]